MGKIIIQNHTTLIPLQIIGYEAGVCWGADVNNESKNVQRAIDCIRSNHGRVLEFPQVYITLEGYSARVIRELYTHIGGSPTRMQESTRYVDYKDFKYVTPKSIMNNHAAKLAYEDAMSNISKNIQKLEKLGIPREDSAVLLPMAMETKVVLRTNLRNLIDMSRKRMCTRAYWEFRELFNDLIQALKEYSSEWEYLVDDLNVFHPECEEYGFCKEKKTCGKRPVYGQD